MSPTEVGVDAADLDAADRVGRRDRAPTPPATGDRPHPGSWAGVVTVAVGAVALGVVGWHHLAATGSLAAAVASARGLTVGPALLVTVALSLAAERRWPAEPRPARSRAHVVDAFYLLLFAAAVVPALTLVQAGFVVAAGRLAPVLLLGRLPWLPRTVAVVATLAAMDAANWGAHLANHRAVTLWRLHALHHSQEEMGVLTTFRTHPLIHAAYLPSILPALVLGASGPVPAAALAAYGCLVAVAHANLRWTFGPVGRVVVSPAYHRLHHAREVVDPAGAVNLGFVLVCWDQLAHRSVRPRPGVPVPTGLPGRPVPVEQATTAAGTVRVVLGQLTQPFRLRALTGGAP